MRSLQTEPWEDFLADQLGQVYRRSGVLVMMDNAHVAASAAASSGAPEGREPAQSANTGQAAQQEADGGGGIQQASLLAS